MKIGCCTNINNYATLVRLGYDAISLAGKELAAMDEETFAAVEARITEGPLAFTSVNAAFPPSVKLNGPDYNESDLVAYAHRLCARMQKLGATGLGVGSPNSRTVPADFPFAAAMEQFERAMTILCGIAAEYGVTVCIEACNTLETNFITTTDQALAVLRKLQLPNLRLIYDIYHAYMMQESPEIVAEAAPHIACAHICKADNGKRYYPDDACMEACKPYIDALLSAGYDGELATEAFDGDFKAGVSGAIAVLNQIR